MFQCRSAICLLVACLPAIGCQLGPKTLEHTHMHYNNAVQTTGSEEMLLNLVRMKYRDPIEFVRIPSITGQHTFNSDSGIRDSVFRTRRSDGD